MGLDDLRTLGLILVGQSTTLGTDNEHRRTLAGDDVVEVRGVDGRDVLVFHEPCVNARSSSTGDSATSAIASERPGT